MRWLKRLFRRIFSKRTAAPSKISVNVKTSDTVREMIKEEVIKSDLPKMLPADHMDFNFKLNDLTISWTNMMLEMAKWESKLDASKEYAENFRDAKGNYVISTGLFQISVESLRGYGVFVSQEQLKDPRTNIKGALAIIIKLVKDDNRIAGRVNGKWKGVARYFSVMRGSRDYTAKALTAIKKANK